MIDKMTITVFILLIAFLLIVGGVFSARAEDGRCGQLRALKAAGAEKSYTKAQVAAAYSWYRSNCGKVRKAEKE